MSVWVCVCHCVYVCVCVRVCTCVYMSVCSSMVYIMCPRQVPTPGESANAPLGVSAHMCQNRELWLSTNGVLPGALHYPICTWKVKEGVACMSTLLYIKCLCEWVCVYMCIILHRLHSAIGTVLPRSLVLFQQCRKAKSCTIHINSDDFNIHTDYRHRNPRTGLFPSFLCITLHACTQVLKVQHQQHGVHDCVIQDDHTMTETTWASLEEQRAYRYHVLSSWNNR